MGFIIYKPVYDQGAHIVGFPCVQVPKWHVRARRHVTAAHFSPAKTGGCWISETTQPWAGSTKTWTGWWYTYPSEKCESVNGNDNPILYEMENKTCLKPPTSENWDLFRNLVHFCNISWTCNNVTVNNTTYNIPHPPWLPYLHTIFWLFPPYLGGAVQVIIWYSIIVTHLYGLLNLMITIGFKLYYQNGYYFGGSLYGLLSSNWKTFAYINGLSFLL